MSHLICVFILIHPEPRVIGAFPLSRESYSLYISFGLKGQLILALGSA